MSPEHNFDHDAEKMYNSFTSDTGLLCKSRVDLVKSCMSSCCKGRVVDAIRKCAKIASDEDGLFIFVYIGDATDMTDFGLGFKFKESNGFVDICPSTSLKRHVLTPSNSRLSSTDEGLSGNIIGAAIRAEKPCQTMVILECPFAEKIASDMRECLSNCTYIEVVVPHEKRMLPCYYDTLKSSAFSHFFNMIVKKTKLVEGIFPIKSILMRVEKCCKALSSIEMIQKGEWLKKNMLVPYSQFIKIPVDPQNELLDVISESLNFSSDEVDGQFRFGPFIERHYPWNPNWKTAKLCKEVVDWVQAVTHACLRALKSENILEGEVLQAVVGTMVFSITMIQMGLKQDDFFPSLFLQALLLSMAAVDLVDPGNVGLVEDSIFTTAHQYYSYAAKINEQKKK